MRRAWCRSVNKYCIITNIRKDKDFAVSKEIKEYLEKHGKKCSILEHGKEHSETAAYRYTNPEMVEDDTDCVLVLGGDGTLIQAARDLSGKNIPLLGVNYGTLGYLAGVEKQNILPALDQLMADDYTLKKHMMLEGTVYNSGKPVKKDVALNDIVISRKGVLRIIDFKIYVNGEFLNQYAADGIIISTPTGSTAYNMSAGGPIVSPDASLLVVTPICPHTLNTRSIILSPEDRITIELCRDRGDRSEERLVSFDGESAQAVYAQDKVEICRSAQYTSIIKLDKLSFLEILREKMSVND